MKNFSVFQQMFAMHFLLLLQSVECSETDPEDLDF